MSLAALAALVVVILAFAVLVYPGELTHLSPRLNRWLYDRAADDYEGKWSSAAYQDRRIEASITDFARAAITASGIARVLDLGCGTGRGIRLVSPHLPERTTFVGIDYSHAMLSQFEEWIDRQDGALRERIELRRLDLAGWAREHDDERFGLVLMLEVGEFVPAFADVLRRAATKVAPGGGLVMTRPAGFWWLFFPSRRQSRRSMTALLVAADFDPPTYTSWRSRYELVFAGKPALPALGS